MLSKVKKCNYWIAGLLIIIGIHLYLSKKLVFFPYPELFIYSYLTSKGLLPYKQILDQHFPGLMFFPINLYTLGMKTPEIARFWHLAVIFFTDLLLFKVAKKFFDSNKKALLAVFLFVFWQPFFEGNTLWIDSFIPLFTLSAFYFLVGRKNELELKKMLLSGLLLGISLVFKQTVLPLIILLTLYLFYKLKKLQKLTPFVVGVFAPLFLTPLYICLIGVWKDFYYWTVTFNLTTFAQMGRKYPEIGLLIRSIPIFGLSLFSILFVWLKGKRNKAVLITLFLVGSLFFAYARFDFIHLQPALPFAIISIVYFLKTCLKKQKQRLMIVILLVVISTYFLVPFYKLNRGNKTKFFGDYEKELASQVLKYAGEDDSVFAMGTTPHLYYLTNTLPPGRIFVFQFPWFMIEAEERILDGIINDPPKVVVRDKSATTGGVNLVSYMGNINKYVEDNYKVIDYVDSTEIMIPK